MGYTHVFEKFDGNRYYDVNDAGTVLIDESDGALITDAKGNKIKFNLSGKIAYTQAALNDKIKKIFDINLTKKSNPINNRKAKEFSYYYDLITVELFLYMIPVVKNTDLLSRE